MTSARELGIPLGRFQAGDQNAIVDVAGVRVGHSTILAEANSDRHGAIRTGVTAIWPHDRWPWEHAVYAGSSIMNGHGELIGICQIQEYGLLRSPILLTSSLSIGAVYDGAARWIAERDPEQSRSNFLMPVVTEVSDLILSDNRAFPIKAEHVAAALASSSDARPAEGCVGAGTGTICYDLKGGIGTASRLVPDGDQRWTVGALVLTNYGERANLTIGGVELGSLLDTPMPPTTGDGSCITVVATDAPLLPHQLDRIAVRAGVGLTRSGTFVGHTSGEIALAFSTATQIPLRLETSRLTIPAVADGFNALFNRLFEATVETVHEAVLGSMFAAETTTGLDGVTVPALPIDQVAELLRGRGVLPGGG
jgi:D-aminopeptidase